jgi:hypothetical protein
VRFVEWIEELVDRMAIAYLRRKVLDRKLESLTDPTFLDRAIAGEKEA